jgi:type I restriction enzyme M protein
LSTPALPLPITHSQLESYLWDAANILRGSPVDRTDWKSYILPLLFFKRSCDVWDEEHAEMIADFGGHLQPRFQAPEGRHGRAVRATTAGWARVTATPTNHPGADHD